MKKQLYLVGIDGSEWSERALGKAVDLASHTGASVTLVYVLDRSHIQPIAVEGIVPPPISIKDEESFASKNVTQPLLDKYQKSGVNFNVKLAWGDPTEVLHKLVKAEHANMIFVGRRGRSRIADLLLGSVANKLSHYCSVPIVLVP